MRDNIKISFRQPEYIVNENKGVVICKLRFDAAAPNVVNFCSRGTFQESPACTTQVIKTVVFAKNGDKFDINVGKKVALAKAENEAYAYVKNWAKKTQKELAMALEAIENFEIKAKKVKEHNIEYMKKF